VAFWRSAWRGRDGKSPSIAASDPAGRAAHHRPGTAPAASSGGDFGRRIPAMKTIASRPVAQIMRADFASLRPEDRLDLADQVMKLGRVRHLPVLDAEGRLVGIVSNRDLLEASLTSMLSFEPGQRRGFLHSVGVAEVMNAAVETVAPETSLGVAAGSMIRNKIGCLPVVRDDGIMIGLVTETDLLIAAYLPAGAGDAAGSDGDPGADDVSGFA
jgi:CBS domain-containing protein